VCCRTGTRGTSRANRYRLAGSTPAILADLAEQQPHLDESHSWAVGAAHVLEAPPSSTKPNLR
jgi:hypothetical protein